ncbi:glyoxalase [Paenibacillus ginsengarvi]|uniref:Glyoxalase n=2 Tax=Paenibacillus ginsengarvi TaxID=400777 RepID=A0A3B0BT79_9BACL|nr:glyoxalase [Paenibacillus ginsengarvi]
MAERGTGESRDGGQGVQEQAKLVIGVERAETAVTFYTEVLGWQAITSGDGGRYALLALPGEGVALLADRADAEGYTARLAALDAKRLESGERHFIRVPEELGPLEPLLQRAEEAGAVVSDELEPGCWRTLTLESPEGHRFAYWQEFAATHEQIMAMFAAAPQRLEAALAGLGDSELDRALAPGKWTIRQQVHHLVDLDMAATHKLKYIIAENEPGRTFSSSRFEQDRWAEGMKYALRPIAAEVALFQLLREHVLSVCSMIPDALARSVIVSGGRTETAAKLMKSMAGHANGHIRKIEQIRAMF